MCSSDLAAGEAGAAGAAGAAGQAGAAGGSACGTSPADHTECLTSGSITSGHLPGKEQAKTTCASCHDADLGKAAKDQCYACHAVDGTLNAHTVSISGKKHMKAGGAHSPSNPACSACHLDPQSLGGNTCGKCH